MARDYDVIVVGAGVAGLAAAVAAADAGASVLLVEGQKQIGGSSRLSGGHFYAAGTSVQTEAGVVAGTRSHRAGIRFPSQLRAAGDAAGRLIRHHRNPASSPAQASLSSSHTGQWSEGFSIARMS